MPDPETVCYGHPSSLLGPTQMPASGAPRLCFWFFCWGFASILPGPSPLPPHLFQPQHISVIWVFWQLKGLGMILNLCFQGEFLCLVGFGCP